MLLHDNLMVIRFNLIVIGSLLGEARQLGDLQLALVLCRLHAPEALRSTVREYLLPDATASAPSVSEDTSKVGREDVSLRHGNGMEDARDLGGNRGKHRGKVQKLLRVRRGKFLTAPHAPTTTTTNPQ